MLPVEHHRLDHVVQMVSILEGVVLRSFGPDGGQVLFIRDTGQVMLTRHGTRILTALRLEHPLAKMVVECVWKHSGATGDGSKTFVLLLASLLRGIQGLACKTPPGPGAYSSQAAGEVASARVLAHRLLAFGLDELPGVIAVGVAPYSTSLSLRLGETDVPGPAPADTSLWGREDTHAPVDRRMDSLLPLLVAFFHTRLGHTHSDTVSRLACELLSHWLSHDDFISSLRFLDAHFSVLHTAVSGFPIGCSRVIEGQVIHRDLSTPPPQADRQPTRGMVVKDSLHPSLLREGEVLQLGEGVASATQYRAWTERALEGVFARLEALGVTLLLSAVKQSEAAVALARRAGVCLVECVGEEDLGLFCQLSGAEPVSDCRTIGPEHVVALTLCRPLVLGAHRYVQVGFPGWHGRGERRPHSLVVCGPGEGQTEQCVGALHDALRVLLATWTGTGEAASHTHAASRGRAAHAPALSTERVACPPGSVTPVGGAFEFLLHRALLQGGPSRSDAGATAVRKLLADSVLSVPRQLHGRRPRRFLLAQSRLLESTQAGGRPLSPAGDGRSAGAGGDVHRGPGWESVSGKHRLLLAVLQCAGSLLRVDALLRVHGVLHTKDRRRSDTSRGDAEEEDD
ncbi:BBSome complex assembly protein BBS10 [Aplochiton taeniatus]